MPRPRRARRNPDDIVIIPQFCATVMQVIVERDKLDLASYRDDIAIDLAKKIQSPPSNGLVDDRLQRSAPYLDYLKSRGLLTMRTRRDGDEFALSTKAQRYSGRWPTWSREPVGAGASASLALRSPDLERYLTSFIGEAWVINVPISGRIEVVTAASDLGLAVETDALSAFDATMRPQWPRLRVFVVSNAYPPTRDVPAYDNIDWRPFPHSPQEFVALLLPLIDKYHP